MKVNQLVNHVSSCVYEIPRLLSLLVLACILYMIDESLPYDLVLLMIDEISVKLPADR